MIKPLSALVAGRRPALDVFKLLWWNIETFPSQKISPARPGSVMVLPPHKTLPGKPAGSILSENTLAPLEMVSAELL